MLLKRQYWVNQKHWDHDMHCLNYGTQRLRHQERTKHSNPLTVKNSQMFHAHEAAENVTSAFVTMRQMEPLKAAA